MYPVECASGASSVGTQAEALFQAALQLPESERAYLAGRLLRSNERVLGADLQQEIIKLTNLMFNGEVHVETSVDPEYPDTIYHVFRVIPTAKGEDIEAIIDRELAWHRQVARIAPSFMCRVRLLIE
jgi:hypothetical protein